MIAINFSYGEICGSDRNNILARHGPGFATESACLDESPQPMAPRVVTQSETLHLLGHRAHMATGRRQHDGARFGRDQREPEHFQLSDPSEEGVHVGWEIVGAEAALMWHDLAHVLRAQQSEKFSFCNSSANSSRVGHPAWHPTLFYPEIFIVFFPRVTTKRHATPTLLEAITRVNLKSKF